MSIIASLIDRLIDSHLKSVQCSYILEFDGASKGNPGQAGAGAVLRAADGSLVCCCLTCVMYVYLCNILLSDLEFCRFIDCVKVWALQLIMLLNIDL